MTGVNIAAALKELINKSYYKITMSFGGHFSFHHGSSIRNKGHSTAQYHFPSTTIFNDNELS